MTENYMWSFSYLPANVKSIAEIGSLDALDAIHLSQYFNCEVLAFEPNPSQFKICQQNIARSTSRVQLRSEALSNENSIIDFFKVDEHAYDNPGASGLFQISFDNRDSTDPDRNHPPVQSPVKVKAVRWDSLGLPTPELVVMDCEGAELLILKGFGSKLQEVKFIVMEASQVAIGPGACTFNQLHKYLTNKDFEFVASSIYSDEYMKLRFRLMLSSLKRRIRKPFGSPLRGRSFDVIYRKKIY